MTDWTEKYRPTTLSEVRGNDASRDDLREWAETWDEHREAAIVHGRPGVGKTSAVHALANDLGWEVIELNASDQRTESVVERVAGEAARSGTLTGGSAGRKLVLLDEADNLHGNADRGGAGAITRLVKSASQPVVLVANEYYDMSNALRGACREIEFRDVSRRSIVPVLRDICRREGIEFEEDALQALAERDAGDLRSAINDLQALAEVDRTLTVDDVVTGDRDRTEGVFDLLEAVLQDEDAEGALRFSYDVDETPDDVVSWVADNVHKDYDGVELARAYRFLANADRWLGRVRATQNYRYWRYASDNATAGVAAARDGPKSGWTRYGPPSYWSKLGSTRGARQTRDDVARKVAERGGFSVATARREVVPFLAAMTAYCRDRELTVAMAAAYDLDAEHVAFVTGSGEDTNKVQEVVADARRLRNAGQESGVEEVAAEDRTLATATAGDPGGTDASSEAVDASDPSDAADEPPTESAADDDEQSGLTDFM
ncbi:MAG: replication factor C large subunit [Halobacteriaceae archaeon]